MTDLHVLAVFLIGIAVRLVIPVLVTVLAVYLLRRLDAHWQSEGMSIPANVEKPACWEINGCPPAQRKECSGYLSPLPCWQARRSPNGYLREECLSCKVFLSAPLPNLG
jgi:hypothetical protein